MENGCAGWVCLPNRKLAVFGQFLVGGGGSKGEGSSERFSAEIASWACRVKASANCNSCSSCRRRFSLSERLQTPAGLQT